MRSFLALLGLLLAASSAAPQDWPCWRGAGRDGKLTGFKAPASWELKKGWSVAVGEGHSTPALVDGKLYVFGRQGGDEVTLCLEAATGKEVWRDSFSVDAEFMTKSAAKSHGKGPFSSPAVADGRVMTLGIRGTLSCLEAKSGKVLWRQEFRDRFPEATYPAWGAAMSPLVVEGLVVAHVGGDKKGALAAFDVATGKEKWAWEADGPGYASPILATVGGKPQIITLTSSHAVGVSPSGALLWKVEYKTNYDQNSVTPVVSGNLVILSGTGNGVVAYRIDGAQPEQAWQTSDVSMYMSSPLLKGERLFGLSEKKKGQFFCLDAKSGGAPLWTSGARQGENAALLDGGDVILALVTQRPDGSDPSTLVVFEASDKEFKEVTRVKVADLPAWAHPVVSGHAIYVKDKSALTQWTLP